MDDSILNTIKKMLGPDNDDPHFDVDIIVHINSALSRLAQLGVDDQSHILEQLDAAGIDVGATAFNDAKLDCAWTITHRILRHLPRAPERRERLIFPL